MSKYHLAAGIDPTAVQLIADTQAVQNIRDAAMGNTTAAAVAGALRMVDQYSEIGLQAKLNKSLGYPGTLPGAMALSEKQAYLDRLIGDSRAANPHGQLDKAAIAAALGQSCAASVSVAALQNMTKQCDLDRIPGISNVASAFGQLDKAVFDDTAGVLKSMNVADTFKQTSTSELAAEALGRQLVSTVGFDTAASPYLQSQSTVRAEIERAMGGSIADSIWPLDRAGLDTAMGCYDHPTASEVVEQIERERTEKANQDAERRLNTIEVPRIHFYDHRTDEDRRLERERKHKLEIERLAVFVRRKAEDEYDAQKQVTSAVPLKAAPAKRQTWRDVAMVYVVGVYMAGQYATAKAFYRALLGKAGTDSSPFQKGTGANGGSLFVQVISKPLSLKALENAMPEIRQAAK